MLKEPSATTHFGAKQVPLADKQAMVNQVFEDVASRYDLMNDLMSGGVHRLWKDAMVQDLAPPRQGAHPYRVLDLAGGTGDVAERILSTSHGYADVTVADINAQMLAVGRERAKSWRYPQKVSFIEANAEALPFENASFDAVTIAFGIRNVPRIEVALGEIYRVLRPLGRFLCLEFSKIDVDLLAEAYQAYSQKLIPPMGRVVTGDAAPYQYLIESISNFPEPVRFSSMITTAGFKRVTHTPFSANIAALHGGWKI